jgi:hypothetical protein
LCEVSSRLISKQKRFVDFDLLDVINFFSFLINVLAIKPMN